MHSRLSANRIQKNRNEYVNQNLGIDVVMSPSYNAKPMFMSTQYKGF